MKTGARHGADQENLTVASPSLNRFFGGPPAWVLVRLVLLSIVIGVIFSVLGIHPVDLIDNLQRALERIWEMGFDAVKEALGYFVLGAMVVFPIWLVLRAFKVIGRRGGA